MKKLFGLVSILILLSTLSFAQFTTGYNPKIVTQSNGCEIEFRGTLSTTGGTYDSLRSVSFSLDDYDASAEYFTVYHDWTVTTGTPNICVDLYASEDNSTFTLLEQIIDTTTTATPVWAAKNLSNKRAKYYKIDVEQLAAATGTFIIKIKGAKKDF